MDPTRDQSAIGNPTSSIAFIALGSNLGDSALIIRGAMARLESVARGLVLKSSLWSSTPVDCPAGSPMFVNAVAALHPRAGETPETLIEKLQSLEREFGREPKVVLNGPRPLDLDLIAFGNEVRSTPSLTLPHPRSHSRRFVLEPLCEIAPELILPNQTQTVAALLAGLRTDEKLIRLGAS